MKENLADAIARLADFLLAWGRPAALIGGMAIVARVRARPTKDFDVVIAVGRGQPDALLELASECGYQYDADETALLLEGGLLQLWGPTGRGDSFGLDLLFVDSPFLERVVARATPVEIFGKELRVASLEDLVLLKLDAYRPIDLDDLLAIKDAFGSALDLDYLRTSATELRLEDRLRMLFPSE